MTPLPALILAVALPLAHPSCEWASSEPARRVLSSPAELAGDASYYSASLDGSLTSTGERFHNDGFTAAHKTLPLGTVVIVHSNATGREIMVRVNDRGPFGGNFVIDLSRAAAAAIGVDVSEDRSVRIEILRLP